MNHPIIKLHNGETNEVIEREMTEKEYAGHLEYVKIVENEKLLRAEAAANKEAALAKLAALGLTAEDLKALGL
jgi:hypothetical protein